MDHQSTKRADRAQPKPEARAARGAKGGRLAQLASGLNGAPPVQRLQAQGEALAGGRPNRTGLPDGLKNGIEQLSGMSMDHVRVHRNSARPAQMQAHAFAQGSDIHLAPGQDRHLPHEAWHTVQQAQGRVRPTAQLAASVAVNDDKGLEAEATRMGEKALGVPVQRAAVKGVAPAPASSIAVVQRAVWESDDKLNWKLHDGDPKSVAPKLKATGPGEFYDDKTGELFEDAYAYAEHLSGQLLSATDMEEEEGTEYQDKIELPDEEDEDLEEEETSNSNDDNSMDTTTDMSSEDRLKIRDEALQKPVLTSLLTGSTGRYDTRAKETELKFSSGGRNNFSKRTKKSGPVTITLEKVELWIGKTKKEARERPILVEGIVEPTKTKGRGGAPDPQSGVQVYYGKGSQPKQSVVGKRNTGIPDSERGHIMALELGGPDISENIVPQWAKFQGSGVWRRMEVAVLAKAVATEKAGGKLKYRVEVFYKDTKDVTPTLRTFGFPTGFKATTQVVDAKSKAPSPIDIEFHQGQAQDQTDQMMGERKMSKLDGGDWDKTLDIQKKGRARTTTKTPKPRTPKPKTPKLDRKNLRKTVKTAGNITKTTRKPARKIPKAPKKKATDKIVKKTTTKKGGRWNSK